jgi:photoactive yellow protein
MERKAFEGGIDAARLDDLPFGCILVDREGTILFFNEQEEEHAGRKRDEVLGKNFFTEVAPCAQVREFYDKFKEVVADTGILAMFKFEFPDRSVHILITSFRHNEDILCLIVIGDLDVE